MDDVVKELFEYSQVHHEESEAVIKIALLIMHCDENIESSEIELLDRILFITRFAKNQKVAELVTKTRLSLLENIHDIEKIKFFIDECVSSINTKVITNSLVKMAELIANADHDYSKEEKAIIDYLSVAIKQNHA